MARRGVSSRASQGWAEGKGRNGYPIAGEMDRWSSERSGHALRGAISRDLGLLIICAWNGIACIRSGGVRLVRIYIHMCMYRARLHAFCFFRSLRFFIFFSPTLALYTHYEWIYTYMPYWRVCMKGVVRPERWPDPTESGRSFSLPRMYFREKRAVKKRGLNQFITNATLYFTV